MLQNTYKRTQPKFLPGVSNKHLFFIMLSVLSVYISILFSDDLSWEENYCILLYTLSGQRKNAKDEETITEHLK